MADYYDTVAVIRAHWIHSPPTLHRYKTDAAGYRQFSEDGIEVALRASRHHVWGPPILLAPEKLHEPYEQAATGEAPQADGERGA